MGKYVEKKTIGDLFTGLFVTIGIVLMVIGTCAIGGFIADTIDEKDREKLEQRITIMKIRSGLNFAHDRLDSQFDDMQQLNQRVTALEPEPEQYYIEPDTVSFYFSGTE